MRFIITLLLCSIHEQILKTSQAMRSSGSVWITIPSRVSRLNTIIKVPGAKSFNDYGSLLTGFNDTLGKPMRICMENGNITLLHRFPTTFAPANPPTLRGLSPRTLSKAAFNTSNSHNIFIEASAPACLSRMQRENLLYYKPPAGQVLLCLHFVCLK